MDVPSKTVIDVLSYLLPGFITAALIYSLTPAPRPIPFERVIQALIFTILIQVAVNGARVTLLWLGRRMTPWGPWTPDSALAWSVTLAVGVGVVFSWAANSDKLHGLLRRIRITHQTSYASEWYGSFCRHKGYVVLHLAGRRRLLGWAEEWPSAPDTGHFVVMHGQWLDEDNQPTDLTGVQRILVKATDVEMVEMMQPDTGEKIDGRPQGTDAAATTTGKI